MRRYTDRVATLLRHRGVVDHQKGVTPADQPVGFGEQRRVERSAVPDPGRDEVVKLVIPGFASPSRHWLYALAITRADQPGNVLRTHPTPRRMRQPCQERLQPSLQIASPALIHHHCT